MMIFRYLKFKILFGVTEYLNKRQKCSQTYLMILTHNALLKFSKAHVFPALLNDGARYRHFDTKELITLTILAGTCLEESHQPLNL